MGAVGGLVLEMVVVAVERLLEVLVVDVIAVKVVGNGGGGGEEVVGSGGAGSGWGLRHCLPCMRGRRRMSTPQA